MSKVNNLHRAARFILGHHLGSDADLSAAIIVAFSEQRARVAELEDASLPKPMHEAKRDGRCIIITIDSEPEVVTWFESRGMGASGWYRQSDSDPVHPDDDEWWELPGGQPTHRLPDKSGEVGS